VEGNTGGIRVELRDRPMGRTRKILINLLNNLKLFIITNKKPVAVCIN
jgi:hypothetical protein